MQAADLTNQERSRSVGSAGYTFPQAARLMGASESVDWNQSNDGLSLDAGSKHGNFGKVRFMAAMNSSLSGGGSVVVKATFVVASPSTRRCVDWERYDRFFLARNDPHPGYNWQHLLAPACQE